MASLLKHFKQTASTLREEAIKVSRGDYINWQKEYTITRFDKAGVMNEWLFGCDKDIGGFSHAQIDLIQNKYVRFHGFISRKLPEDTRFKKTGYAMIRSKKPTANLFTDGTWDSSPFRYLALRVRAQKNGFSTQNNLLPITRTFMVNLYSEVVVKTDMYQHRLICMNPGQWETVVIPFNEFTLTSNGMIIPQQTKMYRQKMASIGFSISDRKEGYFGLDIAWIKAINSINTDGEIDRIPEHRDITWKSELTA